MRRWLFLVVALAACPQPPDPQDPSRPVVKSPSRGDIAPTLEIRSPARGRFSDDGSVTVEGRVIDDGPVRVSVNGTYAAVAADGTFVAKLQLPRGLAIVETHAIDATNHDVRDVRAVLAGPFAPSNGTVAAPMGARIGRKGVAVIGRALATTAKAIDFKQAAQALNPIYEETGCLGARVDIANLSVGNVDVSLAPASGALEMLVRVDAIEVKLDVHYRVGCMGGSAAMTVRTNARMKTDMKVTASAGRFRSAFPQPDITLDDFQIELKGAPSVAESLLRRVTRPAVEIAIAQVIRSRLAPVVDDQLGALLTRPSLPQVLGRELEVNVQPSWIDLAPLGVAMVADAKIAVRGGSSGRYVLTKSWFPVPTGDAVVWVSSNTMNQLLAGLWAARAFERTLSRDQLGPLQMLLDERVATLELGLALPPTIHADTTLELAVGDLMVTTRDAAGAEVQRFAVSLRTGLAIKPDKTGSDQVQGGALATTEPTVLAQVIAEHGTITKPLDAGSLESIVKGVWSLIATNIDDALAEIPVPGLAKGATVKSLTATNGIVVLELALP